MNVFKYSHRAGFGNTSLDGISFYCNFPHFPHPYDVCLTSSDSDTFPFVMYTSEGQENVIYGTPDETHQALLSTNNIDASSVTLMGRGWKDSHVIIIDQKELELETLLKLEKSLKQATGMEIGSWKIFGNSMEVIVPQGIIDALFAKLNKRIHRLLLYINRIKEEATPREESNDTLKETITQCINDYELFATYGKTDRLLHDDKRVIRQLMYTRAAIDAVN